METKMTDVTIHIDEDTTHEQRESLRNNLLIMKGIMAADYHDEKPHLMIVEYDPDTINSTEFVNIASKNGLHAQLVGL